MRPRLHAWVLVVNTPTDVSFRRYRSRESAQKAFVREITDFIVRTKDEEPGAKISIDLADPDDIRQVLHDNGFIVRRILEDFCMSISTDAAEYYDVAIAEVIYECEFGEEDGRPYCTIYYECPYRNSPFCPMHEVRKK